MRYGVSADVKLWGEWMQSTDVGSLVSFPPIETKPHVATSVATCNFAQFVEAVVQ